MYLMESCFSDCFKVSFVVPQFKETDGKRLKTTALLVFFLWLVKYLKILLNNRLVDHLKKYGLFLISSMVSGLLDQLQIL